MSTAKVLLTGGAGYIGSHTAVELINQGFEVVVVDDLSRSEHQMIEGIEKITGKPVLFYKGDCADASFLQSVFEKEKIGNVIHFAAYKSVGESVENPLLYYRNNLLSMVTLLAEMKRAGVSKIIFSSSCTVYGQPEHIPVDESAPFKKAESPYGATKQMCERILEDATVSNKNLKVISLRYFNPVGAHPSALIGELPIGTPSNLVPFITQTAAGIRTQLTVFGNDYNTPDGSCVRDFIHVVDLAKAHVKAVQAIDSITTPYETFNIGTGKGETVLELIKKFISVTSVKLNYTIGARRPGDVEKIFAEPRKAREVLKWKAEQTLEDSLLHAWNWEKKLRGLK
ncbi:MAG: UDP-glucose 4-epimerase GalE [Bacteroidetes bacterium]|nr:UDP-glucose 4-epimerase GalE [Bacteroidota bacterium]